MGFYHKQSVKIPFKKRIKVGFYSYLMRTKS
ncbi:hypothetical protein N406_02890 [Helicobacter pylori FD577]|nr:hypothetical protein N406_02890 [Helicobacter pylori FD577]